MPVYQYMCEHCIVYRELQMSLSTKCRVDMGRVSKRELDAMRCPKCGKQMRYLIAPARLSSSRACYGC